MPASSVTASRVGSYPCLKEGTSDYTEGNSYTITSNAGPQDDLSICLEHRIRGNNLVRELILEGRAVFACTVTAHHCAYSKVFISRQPLRPSDHALVQQQDIRLNPDEINHPIRLQPHVITRDGLSSFRGEAHHGLGQDWLGALIEFPSAAFLAVAPSRPLLDEVRNILRLQEDKENRLPEGCFEVDAVLKQGFYFRVLVAPDLYESLQHSGSATRHCSSIYSAALAQGLQILQREYQGLDLKEYPNLRRLNRKFREESLPTWRDSDFNANRVVAVLYPHKLDTSLPVAGPAMRDGKITRQIPLYSAEDLKRCRKQLAKKCSDADEQDRQAERMSRFLKAVADKNPEKFLDWFSSCAQEGVVEVSFRAQAFKEEELLAPSMNTEQHIYQILSELPPRLAALPSFWNSYHLEMVRQNLIEPSYLARATRPSLNETGRARIRRALEEQDEKMLEDCTWSVLRHMGGLPEKRVYSTVYTDCGIARAWWRGHLSHQVVEDMGLDLDDVWETLRVPGIWEPLMRYGIKQLTNVNDRMIRAALVARLLQEPRETRQRMQIREGLLNKISSRCKYQSLGALTPEQNLEIFRSVTI